jgi:hypothetical protein
VGVEHLAGDLGVPRLIRAYQAKLISTEDGNEAKEQKEGGYREQNDELAHGDGVWQLLTKPQNGCVVVPCAGRGG